MGLGKNSGSNNVYLNIMFGKLVKRAKSTDEGAVSRQNKKDETVWEEHFDDLEGKITEITIRRNSEFGDELKVTFLEGGTNYIVGIQTRSGYGRGFFRKMLNIDYTKMVKIAPYNIEQEDGKFKAFLGVYQGGEKIQNMYTKDNPNGMPELEQTTFKGKMAWDDTKQMKFLEEELAFKVLPMIEEAKQSFITTPDNSLQTDNGTGGMAPEAEMTEPEPQAQPEGSGGDDLPF